MKEDVIVQSSNSPTPISLLQLAIEKGQLDTTQLKELMDLEERWERNKARKEFFKALSKFQTLVPIIHKTKTANVPTKTGGSFSYKHSDLAVIAQTIKKAMNLCGLSYRWEAKEMPNGKMEVTCLVSHIDGHIERTSMEAGADDSGAKNQIQQKGSTHTYLKRYTLLGALGLSVADEDNDGKGGAKKALQVPPKKKNEVPDPSRADIIDQWDSEIKKCKTQIALQALYLKNQKTVDGDAELQNMFKAQQEINKKPGSPTTKNAMI